jgi:hypothetical protein
LKPPKFQREAERDALRGAECTRRIPGNGGSNLLRAEMIKTLWAVRSYIRAWTGVGIVETSRDQNSAVGKQARDVIRATIVQWLDRKVPPWSYFSRRSLLTDEPLGGGERIDFRRSFVGSYFYNPGEAHG